NVTRLLADSAVAGFKVNEARIAAVLDRNPILVTALNPVIGYEKGAAIAKKAYAEGRPIREVAGESTNLPREELARLLERAELTILFTQRAPDLRNHAGQISFPGGRIESRDEGSPRAAALREAREEIGLEERFVSVIGYLPDHLVISGFRVTPVVAF